MSFTKFGEFFAIISWNIFFCNAFFSPPRGLLTHIWDLLVLSNRFLSLCVLFVNHFSLCYSDWRIYMDRYSKSVNLLLSPSKVFLISVIVFSKLRFPFHFLCIFCSFAETSYVSIDFKCICSYFLECFCDVCFKVSVKQLRSTDHLAVASDGCLSPCELRWVNLDRLVEYYVMIFWLLVKSYENVDIFVLSGSWLNWVQFKFLPSFPWLLFQCQFCLQSLYDAFRFSPRLCHPWPVWAPGDGLSYSPVLKGCDCC